MKKKLAVITGAAGGIGKATVECFKQNGWDVAPLDIQFPRTAGYIDVSNPFSIMSYFNKFPYFGIDALINNAAVQVEQSLDWGTLTTWEYVINTNLRSVFLMTKYAYPYLKQGNNKAIVNVSSVHSIRTSGGIGMYAASKGGVNALTRAMAVDFEKDKIRCNAVLPGATQTHMLRDNPDRQYRVGEPEEIANMIYFLSDSKQSSFVNGQCYSVDGGTGIKLEE